MIIYEHFLKFFGIILLAYLGAVHLFPLVNTEVVQSTSPVDAGYFYIIFILLSFAVFVILVVLKFTIMMKLMEIAALLGMTYILFFAYTYESVVSAIMSLLVLLIRFMHGNLGKEVAAILMSAGGAILLGLLLSPLMILLLVIGLSIYDFIAVFVTGHMIKMAQQAEKAGLAMTISSKSTVMVAGKPVHSSFTMGTGDIVLPAAMAVSTYVAIPTLSLPMLGAAILGYWLVVLFVAKLRKPIPALAPIMLPQIALLLVNVL